MMHLFEQIYGLGLIDSMYAKHGIFVNRYGLTYEHAFLLRRCVSPKGSLTKLNTSMLVFDHVEGFDA